MSKPKPKTVTITRFQLEQENGIMRGFIDKFAQHRPNCQTYNHGTVCTCGFDVELTRLQRAVRPLTFTKASACHDANGSLFQNSK